MLDNNEPTSYEEAMVGPYSDEWLEAIKSERGSMTLEEILDGRKAVGYRWILKGRRMQIVMLPSIWLDLSLRVVDKFKGLTTMRLSLP